jgi:[acyl-carrier-protein] S-malonyltransferase
MLSSFSERPIVDSVIDRASSALKQDMRSLIADGPVDDLNLTVNTNLPC